MSTKPGADELHIRSLLFRQQGVADSVPVAPPAAEPEPVPPADPDGWWDELYADEPPAARRSAPRIPDWWNGPTAKLPDEPEPEAEQEDTGEQPEEPEGEQQPEPTPRPRRAAPLTRAPRQSLTEAAAHIPPRIRWLIWHATAAAAGWPTGLITWGTNTAAWYADGHWTTPSAWILYGLGCCAIGLYRRARGWMWPAAWAATIPVSSITVGVLLYGTT